MKVILDFFRKMFGLYTTESKILYIRELVFAANLAALEEDLKLNLIDMKEFKQEASLIRKYPNYVYQVSRYGMCDESCDLFVPKTGITYRNLPKEELDSLSELDDED